MAEAIDQKFKRSYKDEYDALYEAVFGHPPNDAADEEPFGVEDDVDDLLFRAARVYDGTQTRRPTCSQVQHTDGGERTSDITDEHFGWATLPDLLLEQIFSHLNMQQRYWASMACKSWYHAFLLGNSWRTFIFDDKTLTRRRFNYYSGWQYMLDHLRTEPYLKTMGKHIRTLIFKPITNFYNLYEFMNMISFYAEQRGTLFGANIQGIGSRIKSLQYTFPCNMATRNETRLYGTGGKLLDALKRLMGNLQSLRDLRLEDLMLDTNEALKLLDDVCYTHCLTMKKLVLVNISKVQCPLLHAGVFLNIKVLMISPQSLSDDVLSLLADTSIRHLHIIQNTYTPTDVIPITRRAWQMCQKYNPQLQVHLHVKSRTYQNLIWQESAHVCSILINSPQIAVGLYCHNQAQADFIANAVDNYKKTIRVVGHMSIPRSYQSRSFNERIDSHLLYLCHSCVNLQTLVIRDKISTATILLTAFFAKKLKFLYVRKNSVILRSDWTKNPDWSDDLFAWIKTTSRSYQATETEVSSLLGYRWRMLSDKEFLQIDPKTQYD